MIAETQAVIVQAVIDHRGLRRIRVKHRDRELALATLEAELEELNLRDWSFIPPGYRERYEQLLDQAQLTDTEREALRMLTEPTEIIAFILGFLMTQPAPLDGDVELERPAWCDMRHRLQGWDA